MDPISAMLIGSAAMQAIGAITSFEGAKEAHAAQVQQIGLEQKAEGVRRQYMETDARRKQLEVVRNQQRARALALTNSTSQGASFGSGLQGGYGQIGGASGTNLLAINQNLESGEHLFDINAQISQTKIAQANAGTLSATGQGISSLGSSLGSVAGQSRQLFGGGSIGFGNPLGSFGPGGLGQR